MSEHLCKSKGFTLIEIMIVLGIIAILAAIAIPLFDSYSDDAKIEELKSVMLVAAVSQEKYFATVGKYSASQTDLAKYDFPVPPTEKMKLYTGVILRDGVGMSYWVNGMLDLDGEKECWLYVGSSVGTNQATNFVKLKPNEKPYTGIKCD